MLKYQLDSLDSVDESARDLYTEKDGTYFLKVDGLPETPDVDGLKQSRDTILEEKKKLQKQLKEIKDAQRQAEREQADKAEDADAVRAHYQKELDSLKTANSGLLSKLNSRLVHDEAVRIATKYAVDTDSIETLAALVKNDLVMVEDEGEYVTAVKGSDGKPNGLAVDEYEKELVNRKSLSRLLKASDATGSGASGSTKGGGAALKRGNFGGDKADRIAALKSKFPDLAAS